MKDMNGKDIPEWLQLCLKCKHCYKKNEHADTVYCRSKKGCKFEEYVPKKKEGNK